MSSSSQSATIGAKRKKPPTFQHLPEHRAKTLKKAWVEKTKIKSQWKAQKRKEDLASRTKLDIPVYEDETRHDDDADSNDEEDVAGPSTSSKNAPGKAPYVHPSRSHIHPDEPVNSSKPGPSRRKESQNNTQDDGDDSSRPLKKRKRSSDAEPTEEKPEADAAQSLRELKREAYSAATLHTFKSDPLKKNKHHQTSATRGRGGGHDRGRGRGRGGAAPSRGGRGGRGGYQGTGRGQPNMKLRMNAMLAEIKQSLA